MNNKKRIYDLPIHPELLGTSRFTNKSGFTLIELIISVTIILIISLGFFGWASTIIQTNLSIEKNNTAYTIALDVAERLQRMYDSTPIQPKSGNAKYVGYDDGTDKDGDGKTLELNRCSGSSPSLNLDVASKPGLTVYTNPWNGTDLYLYDGNNCDAGKTWVDAACTAGIIITGTANSNTDHPNTTVATSTYDSISPIRSYRNTTYYAIWSVAYIPCATASTDRRKILVTVYWLDPEPTDTAYTTVVSKISNGTYAIKSVSVIVDKAIGTES